MRQFSRAAFSLCVLISTSGIARAQEPSPQTIAAGAKVYDVNCAPCHGDKLANPGITYDLKRLKANERPRFENSVLNGKGQMPPWKGVLKEADMEAIWAYIRANANE